MKLRLLKSFVVALTASVILTGCIEPVELTKLRRIEEPRVLAGAASAEQFWLKADAIAQAYKAPASERARLAEMIAIGRRADRGQMSMGAYREHHAHAIARYEAQRREARRIATCEWSRVFNNAADHASSYMVRAHGQRAPRSGAAIACR